MAGVIAIRILVRKEKAGRKAYSGPSVMMMAAEHIPGR